MLEEISFEKRKVGELEAGACFIKTKVDAEYESDSLKFKEQLVIYKLLEKKGKINGA